MIKYLLDTNTVIYTTFNFRTFYIYLKSLSHSIYE